MNSDQIKARKSTFIQLIRKGSYDAKTLDYFASWSMLKIILAIMIMVMVMSMAKVMMMAIEAAEARDQSIGND